MKERMGSGVVLTAVVVAVCCAGVWGGPEKGQGGAGELVRKLGSAGIAARRQARRDLGVVRRGVQTQLVANLQSLYHKPDRRFGSTLHFTLLTVADWRLDGGDVLGILQDNITFSLDPSTFPVGARYGIGAYYPAADALRRIGGREVTRSVLQKAESAGPGMVLRTCTWVLRETAGPDAAKAIVALHKERARNDEERRSLEEMSRLLKEGGAILAMPKS